MAQIPDDRLEQVARTVQARKVTPAAVRVVDVPGTGPQLLGNLRQVDALLVALDGFSGTRVPADDLETLKLELLVADRDHVERRLERVAKQAKSGDARLKAEAADLERLLAHLDAGRTLVEWEGELPPELEPLVGDLRHSYVLLAGAVRLGARQRAKERRLARARQPDDPDLQRHARRLARTTKPPAPESASGGRRAHDAGAT